MIVKNERIFYFKCLILLLFLIYFIIKLSSNLLYNNIYQSDATNKSVDYWLSNASQYNNIVMTLEDIKRFNEEIEQNIKKIIDYDYLEYHDFFSKDYIVSLITRKNKYFNIIPNKDYYNFDALNNKVNHVEYAINIRKTNLRAIPTNLRNFSEGDKNFYFDNLQLTDLKYGEPVIILHHNIDKTWAFVQTDKCFGWIETKYLAYTTKDEFFKYLNMDNFIVIIAKNIIIDGKYIDMSVKLQIKNEDEKSYTVLLPERIGKGDLNFFEYKINKNDDMVNKGFLPYTRYNVIKQALKYYDTVYGWGNSNNGIDCSGLIYNVYTTFGFKFPRNSKLQQSIAGNFTIFNRFNFIKRNRKLRNTSPGSLLYLNGHIMLYLGKIGNKDYVIHSISAYRGSKNNFYIMKVIISDINLKIMRGGTLKSNLLSITDIDYNYK